jgi:gas vesicle protein
VANNGTIIGAGLAGLVVGAALGLLYAPRSGEENRAMLKEKAEMVKERAKDMKGKMMRRDQQIANDMDSA